MVLRAKSNAYHLDCFRCSICDKLFKTGDQIAFHEGKIYCTHHIASLNADPNTESSEAPIGKEFPNSEMAAKVEDSFSEQTSNFKASFEVVNQLPSNVIHPPIEQIVENKPPLVSSVAPPTFPNPLPDPPQGPLFHAQHPPPAPIVNHAVSMPRTPPVMIPATPSPIPMPPGHYPGFDFLKLLPPPGTPPSSKGRPRKKKHLETDHIMAAYSTHGKKSVFGWSFFDMKKRTLQVCLRAMRV